MAKIDLITTAEAGWSVELDTNEIVEIAAWVVEKGAMAEVPQPAVIDPITNQMIVPVTYIRIISPRTARVAAVVLEAIINNPQLFDRIARVSDTTDPGETV